MDKSLSVEIGKCLESLACDVDGIFFGDATLAKHGKDRAAHQVHGNPDIVAPDADFSKFDQVGVTCCHDTQLADDGCAVLAIGVKTASLNSKQQLLLVSMCRAYDGTIYTARKVLQDMYLNIVSVKV